MTDLKKGFAEKLAHYQKRVNAKLDHAIQSVHHQAPLLSDAIRYATLNGGKRLRPLLVYAAAEALQQSHSGLDAVAAAIECIHSSSLIHDDLPAMDDDSLRRGKATCHIVFGEATAILAGDALLTLAFELLSQNNLRIAPALQLQLLHTLAVRSGATGMMGGQSLDLLAEGKTLLPKNIEHIHHLKTGALITASVRMGALGAGCDDAHVLHTLDEFAKRLGLAFQLQDDVLDVTGNSKKLGKITGQDMKHEKATYAILYGVTATQQRIATLMEEAIALLNTLPQDTGFLEQLCDHLIQRQT